MPETTLFWGLLAASLTNLVCLCVYLWAAAARGPKLVGEGNRQEPCCLPATSRGKATLCLVSVSTPQDAAHL